jgi:hypothetical protein
MLAALLLGLRVLLPLFPPAPALSASTPSDGDANIGPRAKLTLSFSGPMNPRSVERAIVFDPAVDWTPLWSDDRTTLTISPTQSLRPETSYHLTIGTGAHSRTFHALDAPIELRFRTADAPAVVQLLPADGAAGVPIDSPISIRFSRTIVPTTSLMLPVALSALGFDPPIDGTVTWLDPTTALFRPAAPLRPGTRYHATLAADLTDAAGVQLERPYSWSFSTPAPVVLATWPADGARTVAPTATLALTISQQLDIASVRATLSLSPTATGTLTATNIADGRQVLTYAPVGGWRPDTTYRVTLAAGATPAAGNLAIVTPVSWSFTTAPRPALTARFPGEGQALPVHQPISLVFNTTMDAASFHDLAQFEPPVDNLRVATTDSEVRIAADFRAATAYTMTLPANLADRNGMPLGQDFRMRFLTAPAAPSLELPEVPAHLAQVAAGRPASLLLRRTNLSSLGFDLYRLDEATTVRTLGFGDGDWAGFQPERYGQPLLRSWRVALADPLNTPAEDRVPLTTDTSEPLPAGAYYLRLRALEGPHADLLLLVARTQLALQTSETEALIWATDSLTGTPVGGLPVALYQGGALTEQGTTDQDGLLRLARAAGSPAASYVALAGGASSPGAEPPFGAVSGGWGGTEAAERDGHRIFATTDRAAYRPGERVQLAGFVRATTARMGPLAPPHAGETLVIARPLDSGSRIYQRTLKLGATGVFSDVFALDAQAPAGEYVLAATIDGDLFQTRFVVAPAGPAALDIVVRAPPSIPAGDPAPLAVEVLTPEGLPVAGATISWTLQATPIALPDVEGYVFDDDDDEGAPAPIAPRTGVGQSDAAGRFTLVISDTATEVPLRYRFIAGATEPGGGSASAEGAFIVAPPSVGVRLPSRIFASRRPGSVELLARSPEGQPLASTRVRVEVYRRTWEREQATGANGAPQTVWVPRDQLALTRIAVTGVDGKASLALELPASGAYRLRAGVAVSSRPPLNSAITLWATAPGFSAWGELPGGQPLLIADRDRYRPGETATLLPTVPFAQGTALVTIGTAGGVVSEVRAIRAGEPFTLTIRPDAAADVPVAVLLSRRTAGPGAAAPVQPLLATTTLPVEGDGRRLDVAIASDAASYLPGATATLTVTTTDPAGMGVPADIILTISGAGAARQDDVAAAFRAATPQLTIAPRPAATPIIRLAVPQGDISGASRPAPTVDWNPALRTGPGGVLTLTVRLPDAPAELRALAWAAAAERFGQAQSTIVVTRPLDLALAMPPRFRAGDTPEIAGRVQNTSSISREVEVSLQATGVEVRPDSALIQKAILGPGEAARFVWPVRVLDAEMVRLRVSARSAGEATLDAQTEQAILSNTAPQPARDTAIRLLREYLDPGTGQPLDLARLRTGQLIRARVTAVATAQSRAISVTDELPAGAVLIGQQGGDLAGADADGRLALTLDTGAPGIYQHTYMLRIVATGQYAVPAPTARTPEGASGVGNALVLHVSES